MTGLSQLHAQVGFVLLASNTNILRVFDGIVDNPTPTPPWVLVYTTVASPKDGVGSNITGQQVGITTTINCHAVGLTVAAARAVADQVRASLLNVRPVIPGRNCSLIKEISSNAPAVDETLGFPYFDAISEYEFTTVA